MWCVFNKGTGPKRCSKRRKCDGMEQVAERVCVGLWMWASLKHRCKIAHLCLAVNRWLPHFLPQGAPKTWCYLSRS